MIRLLHTFRGLPCNVVLREEQDFYELAWQYFDGRCHTLGHHAEVLAAHPDVAECAVVGVADELKGQLPVGCLVLKAGVDRDSDDIVAETILMVRERIGPVAAFRKAMVVPRLPKTRSGKILRGTMRRIADNEEYRMPATIEDPEVLNEIRSSFRTIGYAKP